MKFRNEEENKQQNELSHIAFIMDGNGRWARKRLLARAAGHKEGLKTIEEIVDNALLFGIKYLSFFAFSTENWKRPKSEVDALMKLLKTKLPEMADKLKEKGIRLLFSGDLTEFDSDLCDIILQCQTKTAEGKKCTIVIALNYGGQREIVAAVNKAIEKGKKVNESEFRKFLYLPLIPDPDLLIRTGGEQRLSNFFLFQLAYTELIFTETLWPDFSKEEFEASIDEFRHRTRRYGKV